MVEIELHASRIGRPTPLMLREVGQGREDAFSLPVRVEVKGRADVHKVKLSLGIDGKKPSFTRGRIPSGKIAGIVHVDLFRFIDAVFSQYLQSETLSLNEVQKTGCNNTVNSEAQKSGCWTDKMEMVTLETAWRPF